jgi:hypothetical protein
LQCVCCPWLGALTLLSHGSPVHLLTGVFVLCVLARCFNDGFPDLFVHHATEIRNKHVGFLASFHDPGKIFEQISIIYALPRLFIGSFTLVLPFFPTGTAERVSQRCTSRHAAASFQKTY